MSNEAPWLPLAEAENLWVRAGGWPGSDILSDILKSGRVPVRGKRNGYGRADPIEDLLRRADQVRSYLGRVSVWSALNEITLNLDTSAEHQRIAAELYERTHGRVPAMLEFLEWTITFKDVVVHWPKLVEELQANGFKIEAQRQKPARRKAVIKANPTASALPRPKTPGDRVRAWYEKHIKKHIKESKPTDEEADWKAAQRNFGSTVRRDQVRELRRELAPESWRKQGRRPKAAG